MVTLREALKEKLNKKEMESLIASYDIIGNIAIVEIPEELEKKEKVIAETLLELHKNITTVLKKADIHKGTFRRQKMRVLAGKRTKVAEYKENNSRLKLDVEKIYFSPRSSTERKRIYEQVKKGEKVLVMFSGCAPYPIVISRNTDAEKIYGIELNPIGHKFGVENVELNKCKNVELIEGDVREVIPELKKQGFIFDRIAMPLPKDAGLFLVDALKVAKKGTMIHLYEFGREDEYDEKKKVIRKRFAEAGRKCRILSVNKCGHYSPRVYRLCFDIKVMD